MRISDWSSDVCSSDLAREREFVESLVARDDARMLGAEPVQRLGIDGDIGGARDADELARDARRIGGRRSGGRRVGKEGVRTGRSRWSADHKKKQINT